MFTKVYVHLVDKKSMDISDECFRCKSWDFRPDVKK